jgi:hypothetical protein
VSLIVQSSGAELEVLVVGVVLVPLDAVLHEVDLVFDRVIPVVVGLLQVVTCVVAEILFQLLFLYV